ncbi:MAG: hypothetical protein LN546_01295 [Rickettsia endosymbiont of Ecitomorpha arachnoides]|nr:hypothetical protein [Rickettsia endosymbiont of Ecitomorpha arachnoides]
MAHKDLSHLTQKQLEDLIKRYYDNEKVDNLLKEFNINISPNSLVNLFPLIPHHELFCKYCQDTNLVIRLKGRNYKYYGENGFDLFCPMCNHNDNSSCSCDNCKKAIKQQKQIKEEEKRNLIKEKYYYDYIKTGLKNISIEELTLKDALYLLSVVSHSASKNFEFIEPFSNNPSIPDLTPDRELTNRVINHLCNKGLIVISPSSPLDAFEFDAEKKLQIYSIEKIIWELLPSMNIKEKQQYLDDVKNLVKGEWSSSWKDEIAEMWKQITSYECIEYFKYLLAKRGFTLNEPVGDKTMNTFIDLLKNFSVGQIFNLSWRAVSQTNDYISAEGINYTHGRNMFIGSIQRKAHKAIAEGWTTTNGRRDFNLPQTIISSTFFNTFLELGNEYFENIMPAEYSR